MAMQIKHCLTIHPRLAHGRGFEECSGGDVDRGPFTGNYHAHICAGGNRSSAQVYPVVIPFPSATIPVLAMFKQQTYN